MDHNELDAELLCRSPHPQVKRGMLLFEVRAPHQDGVGVVEVGDEGPVDRRRQKVRRERIVDPGVDIVGAEHYPGKLGERVGILVCSAGATDHRKGVTAVGVSDLSDPLGDHVEGLGPADLDQLPVASDQRGGDPMGRLEVFEAEAILVRQPAMVGGLVVDTDVAEYLVLAGVDRQPRVSCVVKTRALGHCQIPGPRPEAVLRGGESADGADLNGVAREVGREGQVGKCVHLGHIPPGLELDEGIPTDLVREAGAAGTEDASLSVEQNQVGDRNRLLVVAFDLDETTLPRAMRERLVLERALPAFVTDRAVEGMVCEQELENPLLGLLDHVTAGVDDHSVGNRVGARGHQHRSAWSHHFDQTHTTHPHWVHPLVPAETGDVGPVVLSCLDQKRSGSNLMLDAVDGDGDELGVLAHCLILIGDPSPTTSERKSAGRPPEVTLTTPPPPV
jgi:hypothetical protein